MFFLEGDIMSQYDLPSPPNLRRTIIRTFPYQVFDRRPLQILLYIPIVAGMYFLATWMNHVSHPWYLMLLGSLELSVLVSAAVFLAHEVLHGSVVKSKLLQDLAGYIGFAPFLVSPYLWRFWHNKAHHGHTNQGNYDPDSFGTLDRCEREPTTRFVTKLAPGSGHFLSYIFLFYWFTFHGQVILWLGRYSYAFRSFNRKRAVFDSALMLGFWGYLAWNIGWYGSFFTIVIPMLLGNFTIMSYIATNHFLRPQSDHPLVNSMSITSPRWVDALHFNFSHHVEHHLFFQP